MFAKLFVLLKDYKVILPKSQGILDFRKVKNL